MELVSAIAAGLAWVGIRLLSIFGKEAVLLQRWLSLPKLRGTPADWESKGSLEFALTNRGRDLTIEWVRIETTNPEGESHAIEIDPEGRLETKQTVVVEFNADQVYPSGRRPAQADIVLKAKGYPDPIRKTVDDKLLDKLSLPLHRYFDEQQKKAVSRRLERIFESNSNRTSPLRFS